MVTPTVVTTVLPVGSTATSQIAIPNNALLVGATFHHQMLLLDGALPAFTDLVSTNALTLSIGSF